MTQHCKLDQFFLVHTYLLLYRIIEKDLARLKRNMCDSNLGFYQVYRQVLLFPIGSTVKCIFVNLTGSIASGFIN